MPRGNRKMNAARIGASPLRLDLLLEFMKKMPYPFSGEEIGSEIYPEVPGHKKRFMQNVSPYIGEMRSQENQDAGCRVSYATRWKVASSAHDDLGRHMNRDGSVTFLVDKATMPFHDGNPRYYLIAAYGWTPRWIINDAGVLVPSRSIGTDAATIVEKQLEKTPVAEEQRICSNPGCESEIPEDRLKDGCMTCCEECSRAWRELKRPKFEISVPQGRLL